MTANRTDGVGGEGQSEPVKKARAWGKPLIALTATLLAWIAVEFALPLIWTEGSGRGSAGLRELLTKVEEFVSDYGSGAALRDRSSVSQKDGATKASDASSLLHPYTAYSNSWESAAISRFKGQPENVVRVLVLGGSVAAGFHGAGTEALGRRLAEDPRIQSGRVVFIPFGQPGFKQPQQLMRMAHLFAQGVVPDIVIDLSGFNEVAVGQANFNLGAHPAYPQFKKWATLAAPPAGDWSLRVERWTAWRDDFAARVQGLMETWPAGSEIWCELVRRRLKRELKALFRASDELAAEAIRSRVPRHLLGPEWSGDELSVPPLLVEHWKESAISAHAICRAFGAVYYPVLQPAAIDEGSQPNLPDRFRRTEGVTPPWRIGVGQGYPLLREAVQGLQAIGIPAIDLTGVFVRESTPVFKDAVHLHRQGNVLLGEAMASGMIERLPPNWKPRWSR